MTGIEIAAVAYLFTWAKRRAKPMAERAGEEVDQAGALLMDRLHGLVEGRLGSGDKALERLAREAGEAERDAPSETTGSLLSSSINAWMEDDPGFAEQMEKVVGELRAADGSRGSGGDIHNSISGGTQWGAVIQARDIHGLSFGDNGPATDRR